MQQSCLIVCNNDSNSNDVSKNECSIRNEHSEQLNLNSPHDQQYKELYSEAHRQQSQHPHNVNKMEEMNAMQKLEMVNGFSTVNENKLQMQLMAIHLQRMKIKLLPPMSFSVAPIAPLPLWQQVAASAAKRARDAQAEEHKIFLRQVKVQAELNEYRANVRAREERVRRAQRQARAQYGAKIAQLSSKYWTKRGDVFEQLMRVEFDVLKQRADKRRQEDLLRETEELTKKLVDSLLSARAKHAASIENSDNDKNSNKCIADNHNLHIYTNTEKENSSDEVNVEHELFEGYELDQSLALLDTEKGTRPLRDYQRTALHWMVQLYENKLNGILADEMGLGKTVQTIALLCYYAEYKNDWGPHLIVVPTTVVLNWRAELQRWAPGLKVLTYMGNAKERHKLRHGWTGEDAFHVCVTSYNLIVQDRAVFRRRPWGFLILDEAHHVKNFMTKKWQSLFDLQAQYRLLLTGTPLQNSVMELWSLFHFLLPFASAFRSNDEFREWFSNPMDEMVSGQVSLNQDIVRRLQALIRPFMLRRLKKDVEAELPVKTEKVVLCRLSRRQRALYDDFMQLAETKRRLRYGGAGGVLSVLLSLRKVCNHPDLFEERPTTSPFVLSYDSSLVINVPRLVLLLGNRYQYKFANAYNEHNVNKSTLTLANKHYVCNVMDLNDDDNDDHTTNFSCCRNTNECDALFDWLPCTWLRVNFVCDNLHFVNNSDNNSDNNNQYSEWCERFAPRHLSGKIASSAQLIKSTNSSSLLKENDTNKGESSSAVTKKKTIISSTIGNALSRAVIAAFNQQVQGYKITERIQRQRYYNVKCATVQCYYPRQCYWSLRSQEMCHNFPELCPTIAERVECLLPLINRVVIYVSKAQPHFRPQLHWHLPIASTRPFTHMNYETAAELIGAIAFIRYTEHIKGRELRSSCYDGSFFLQELWSLHVRRCFSFPDKRLLIHDCGKLQFLTHALKEMRNDGHRMLIFTQFVHMLDVLERFLALIGVAYLRLDGATRPELRQAYVDKFNEDTRVTCMILSTRSGGIGLNLTGADTVIFYDSDWNPTMDLQAQDRCHRIGQTRPVTIYRLISEHTVEESILQKARERKKLNNVVIRGGQFHVIADVSEMYEDSSAAFVALSNPVNLRSFFHDLDEDAIVTSKDEDTLTHAQSIGNYGSNVQTMNDADVLRAMLSVEDEEDRLAQQEVEMELRERDAADKNEDEENENENTTAVAVSDGHDDSSVNVCDAQERTNDKYNEMTLHYFDPEYNNSNHSGDTKKQNDAVAVADDDDTKEMSKLRRIMCKRQREIMMKSKTSVDRFLTMHYAELNESDAFTRYSTLIDRYSGSSNNNSKNEVDNIADDLPRFRLRLDC